MDYLIKDGKLELRYEPGKGSWTYHIIIPNTQHVRGKWGDIKVSGTIDGYPIENKNLAPIKGGEKLLSINSEIRKAIQKTGGDWVTVTLYRVQKKEQLTEKQVLEIFAESLVLDRFVSLSEEEKTGILQEILSESSEDKQVAKILKTLERFGG